MNTGGGCFPLEYKSHILLAYRQQRRFPVPRRCSTGVDNSNMPLVYVTVRSKIALLFRDLSVNRMDEFSPLAIFVTLLFTNILCICSQKETITALVEIRRCTMHMHTWSIEQELHTFILQWISS